MVSAACLDVGGLRERLSLDQIRMNQASDLADVARFDQRLAAFFTMSARKAASLSRSRIARCMALTS
jgi:hypothetical protein